VQCAALRPRPDAACGTRQDYGPFGFVEQYEPLWSPFTSDAERKFGFERQPVAAQVNVMTLARALLPLLSQGDDGNGGMRLDEAAVSQLQAVVEDEYPQLLRAELGAMHAAKLGLATWDQAAAEELLAPLKLLMERSQLDYTLFWRQLSHLSDAALAAAAGGQPAAAQAVLAPACYEAEAMAEREGEWAAWLKAYASRIAAEGRPASDRQAEMRRASPKYIPREWMLVKAYEAAERGDQSVVHQLEELFSAPYEEQSPALEQLYYRRTPDEFRRKAGVSFFS